MCAPPALLRGNQLRGDRCANWVATPDRRQYSSPLILVGGVWRERMGFGREGATGGKTLTIERIQLALMRMCSIRNEIIKTKYIPNLESW